MDNVLPEGNEDQSIRSPSGEALGSNLRVKRSERTIKSPQRYNPVFGAARECKNDYVASIFYMIQDGDFNSNLDKDDIILLLAEWDSEYCMDTPSTFDIRESYVLKSQSHNPDTPRYMEALSGEKSE